MATTRVWNITDDANPDVKPQNLRVLGKLVKPGRFVTVEEAALKRSHKVNADVGRGLLFIGKRLPASYTKLRKPARAKLADGVGRVALTANRPAPKKVVELEDEVKVEDAAAVEAVPAEATEAAAPPADSEETAAEESSPEKKGKKKKGK